MPTRHRHTPFRALRRTLIASLVAACLGTAQAADPVSIDIAAQPLAAALAKFAEQSGIKTLYAADLLAGKTAPRIEGKLTPQQALEKLLAGSGLRYQFVAADAVKIERAPVEKITELETINVTSTAVRDATRGYQPLRSFAATKTDTPLLDTPVAVQVIPKSVLEDKQIVSIQEAVKLASGVQPPQSSFLYYDTFIVRGLQTGNNVFRNGLKLTAVTGTTDMAFVDRIEIAKGPSSMVYGRVWPGGMVNIVTKAPQVESAVSVQQQVGSWDNYRTNFDATGALNEDKTAAYRLMAVYDKGDSFIDYQHHENKAVAAYFSWAPSAQLKTNLQLEYYDQKGASMGSYAQQIPIVGNRPADLPRHWTQNDPVVWSKFPDTVERLNVAFDWSYALNDRWQLTHRFNYFTTDENQSYITYQAFNATTGMLSRKFSYLPAQRVGYSTNLDLTGEFSTGNVKHKLLAGLDWFWTDFELKGYNEGATLNRIPAINIYAPAYGNIDARTMQNYFDSARANVFTKSRMQDSGLYVQDQMSLSDDWEVLLGGRYDVAKDGGVLVAGTTSAACFPNCAGASNPNYPTDRHFSPRAAVLYKVARNVSVYGSYSKSFDNTNLTSRSFDHSAFSPQTGMQFELGAKASLLGGRLTSSATLFELRQRNILTPDPDHAGYSVSTGEVRSRGLELDLAGAVSRHVSLLGSYTYNPTEVTKDNTAGAANTTGNQFVGVPTHSASLWAKYDTAPGAATGFTYGLGVYLSGERQINTANTAQIPGYGRMDAMVGYRTRVDGRQVTGQLNVQNLFDKAYYEYGGATYVQYGAPRNLMASIKIDL